MSGRERKRECERERERLSVVRERECVNERVCSRREFGVYRWRELLPDVLKYIERYTGDGGDHYNLP